MYIRKECECVGGDRGGVMYIQHRATIPSQGVYVTCMSVC